MVQVNRFRFRMLKKIFIGAAILAIGITLAGILTLRVSPKTGAYGADFLRRVIGNQPVVMMEMALFRLEDTLKKTEFQLGWIKPVNPFGNAAGTDSGAPNPQVITSTLEGKKTSSSGQEATTPIPTKSASAESTTSGAVVPQQSGGSSSSAWLPGAVNPLGGQVDAGVWQPYLHDASGRVLAYRTYVQPDPTRPYAYAAIIAFDIQQTRLNYVVGFDDPYAPGVKRDSKGVIAPKDEQSGLLLAAFNGGFKYEHGHFGSMANGLVSAPAQNGLGTLAIYRDGKIQIGEWGKDITATNSMLAFRQNGPLVIQNGMINPSVDDSLIWGLTITGGTATMRSGIAISPDGRTLYYFAGPSLTVRTLAKAMEATHPQAAIQLDINNFWVHFTAIHAQSGKLSAESLLGKEMKSDKDRYLRAYPRDFFYITSVP